MCHVQLSSSQQLRPIEQHGWSLLIFEQGGVFLPSPLTAAQLFSSQPKSLECEICTWRHGKLVTSLGDPMCVNSDWPVLTDVERAGSDFENLLSFPDTFVDVT